MAQFVRKWPLIVELQRELETVLGPLRKALEWLTTGLELALRTGDLESALEQLRPSHASCLSALGRPSGEIQERAAQGKQGETGER